MNGNTSDERLSAWLDNELSLQARAEFEQELEASPELRQRLHELQQVSSLVKDAAGGTAPDGMHGAVMRAVERESLLSAVNVPGDGHSPGDSRAMGRPGSGRPGSGRLMVLAGIAAALAIAVVVYDRDGDNNVADVDPETGSSRTAPALTMQQPVGRQPANQSQSPEETVRVGDSLRISKRDLDQARVGDMIEGIDADGVSVIRLTVVDRNESSIEALQLLLARESLPDNRAEPVQEGLVAVYVESSPEDLSRALGRLRDSFEFQSLDISSTALADLDEQTQDDLKLKKSGDRVILRPGTRLAQLAEKPEGARRDSADGAAQPNAPTPPVRVIFVVVDQPAVEKPGKPLPTTSGESAA
jgi:negative regulator of sigma E activity